ncbi:homeobox-leucine zipper protein HOX11-like [Olea europaea var. sylvestris]|uniref:homeobox-leucine zipper protein HOX11-like n=1 Tax=Olea europaea var. sylvestris TaxID=158386 RepID=UPI000C1D4B5A|nr:homeobox-leucine zipper protein HOX11-like [Olea europaea var. sylvestris]
MELGLSLGDASKPVGFLTKNGDSEKHKKNGFGFFVELGLNTNGGNQELAEKSHENDGGDDDQTSEDTRANMENTPIQLDLLPRSSVPCQTPSQIQPRPWSSDNGSSENGSISGNVGLVAVVRDLEVNRLPAAATEEASSANSVGSPLQMNFGIYVNTGNGNLGANDVVETERVSSRASDDDENCSNTRKKLRLSKEQAASLEESFKEHSTLNPKQKLALAKQLNLRPRQVEVWFQNRRARTKLKQTEVDCEYLKRCCETLTEENRKLHKELQELRVLKTSNPFYTQLPATTLTMCPSCERVASTSTAAPATTTTASIDSTTKPINPFPLTRPRFYPFSQTPPPAHQHHQSAAS